jgi:hypothetical protein
VRVTLSTRLAVPSATVAAATLNCTVLSLSVMVEVVETGAAMVVPGEAPESVTVKPRVALTTASSRMVTGMVLGALSPSAQLSVPLLPA